MYISYEQEGDTHHPENSRPITLLLRNDFNRNVNLKYSPKLWYNNLLGQCSVRKQLAKIMTYLTRLLNKYYCMHYEVWGIKIGNDIEQLHLCFYENSLGC